MLEAKHNANAITPLVVTQKSVHTLLQSDTIQKATTTTSLCNEALHFRTCTEFVLYSLKANLLAFVPFAY